MPTRHYDGDQVLVVAMGIPVFELSSGDMVSISYTEDDFVTTQGHHGSVIRAKKPNNVAEMTIKVMQGSSSNSLLSAAVASDLATGLGASPSSVKDTNGTSIMSCEASYCKKRPDLALATEPGEVEWVFVCAGAVINVGENRLAV